MHWSIAFVQLRKIVFRLQVRIFKAQKNENLRLVRRLQKLLLSSRAAKLLTIRQVTQLNMGRRTAGVDGKKALETAQRLALFEVLVKNWKHWKHQPLKRVWIPKADGTKRGLGIPTIADRAYQCLLKYTLEPATEAIFNANSFGFRWTFAVRTNDKFISTPSHKSAKKVKVKVKEMMKDNRFNIEERIDKCGSMK